MSTSSTSSSGSFNTILGWLPVWPGFVLILLAGAACVVSGLLLSPGAGVLAFGVAFIAIAVLSWACGAGSTPSASPGDRSFWGTSTTYAHGCGP